METPRHWRLRKQRYGLPGERVVLEDGTVQVKLEGSTTWSNEVRSNGHNVEINTPVQIVYQAPQIRGENGRVRKPMPIKTKVLLPSK